MFNVQRRCNKLQRRGLFDFNLGYWLTAALALVFLSLGALVRYGSEQPKALAGNAFALLFLLWFGGMLG